MVRRRQFRWAMRSPHSRTWRHITRAVVRVRVRYDGEVGWYVPYMWVSNEESYLNGRVNGSPKLQYEDDPLQVEGNEVYGEVNRRG